MTDQHPITPPSELVREWIREADHNGPMFAQVAVMGAQWGADQQLEQDAKWLDYNSLNESHLQIVPVGECLKEAMRPKPPSLKVQALKALQFVDEKLDLPLHNHCNVIHTIRTALEALPND